MFFVYASLIIALACSVITERTLLGYNNVHWSIRIFVFLLLASAWLSPVIINVLRRKMLLDGQVFNSFSNIGYACFGFVFILFIMLFFRDGFWFVTYKFFGKSQSWNPTNVSLLTKVNVITVLLAMALSVYAIFEAIKLPMVKKLEIISNKVSEPITILQINDVHLHGRKNVSDVKNLVKLSNSLNPDVIVMPGDIIDDGIGYISNHLKELSKLSAKYGVYVSAGNHEYYNGLVPVQWQFQNMGFFFLSENGMRVGDSGIYIAGIPDNSMQRVVKEYPKIFDGSEIDDYKILLAHNPKFAKDYLNMGFDLQLSAHTHGGQIFPFHVLVKWANNYLAGKYDIDGKILYISRGAGYWGPPMRLFSPADITLITVKPE